MIVKAIQTPAMLSIRQNPKEVLALFSTVKQPAM
jgi:hypothetical protein